MGLNLPLRYGLLLVWFSSSFISILLLFSRGLLLSKDVLPYKTVCSDKVPSYCYNKFEENVNLCSQYFNTSHEAQFCTRSNLKVVWIIIDALRYDFAKYNASNQNPAFYENKLPIIATKLNESPNNARLYKFIADPPTTTLQRIKGLTTGSLPTFMDVSENFGSAEINEDNLIDSLLSQNKHAVFMGDDTWTKLYRNRFVRSYPYDSFNVWDLDTVDRGVIASIVPEMANDDWSLLIAHLLGVDHCGHRYGPSHPEMRRKLNEMNNFLRDIMKKIHERNDTMLFVMGDHGMTSTGDHGGETENELLASLFVYSPKIELLSKTSIDIVRQIDIVPTIAAILGIPIPHSNIGSVIIDSVPVLFSKFQSTITAVLWQSVQQVVNYIEQYSLRNAQFKQNDLNEISESLSILQHDLDTFSKTRSNNFIENYGQFMKKILKICEDVWVQYDTFQINIGLCLAFAAVFLTFLIIQVLSLESFELVFSSTYTLFCICFPLTVVIFGTVLSYTNSFIDLNFIMYTVGVFFVLQISAVCIIMRRLVYRNISNFVQTPNLFDICVATICIFLNVGLFSNSYILQEPRVTEFLIVSILCLLCLQTFLRTKKITKRPRPLFRISLLYSLKNRALVGFVLVSAVTKYCNRYVPCRDEYELCVGSKHKATLIGSTFSVFCVNMYAAMVRKLLQYNGNTLGSFLNIVVCTCIPKLDGILLSVYWAFEMYFISVQKYYLIANMPLFILITLIASVIYLLYDPLCVYCKSDLEQRSEFSIVTYFVNYVRKHMAYTRRFSCIQGINTVYSAVFVNISVLLGIICSSLAGKIYATPVMLMMTTVWILSFIVATSASKCVTEKLQDISWKYVILWGTSCLYWFYATGHHTSFSSLQWEGAFFIQKEIKGSLVIPGLLMLINTFSSYIIHGVMLLVLLIFPYSLNALEPILLPLQRQHEYTSTHNEFTLIRNSKMFLHVAFLSLLKYLLFFEVRLLVMMISATIHSRHLMMWGIFSPKLIFEGVAFIVATVPSVLIGFLLVLRVTKKIKELLMSSSSYY